MNTKVVTVCDIESSNPERSNNGGDYYFGRTFVIEDGKVVAARHWSSADFPYCGQCGSFDCEGHDDENYYGSVEYNPDDAEDVNEPLGMFFLTTELDLSAEILSFTTELDPAAPGGLPWSVLADGQVAARFYTESEANHYIEHMSK